jgi:hypothetical protein
VEAACHVQVLAAEPTREAIMPYMEAIKGLVRCAECACRVVMHFSDQHRTPPMSRGCSTSLNLLHAADGDPS